MIFKRLSPGANPDNLLQLKELDGFCCGNTQRIVAKKYSVDINTANTPTVKKIKLGGAEHSLGLAYDITSETGVKMLIDAIKVVLWKLGYGDDGISYSFTGNVLNLTTWWSSLSFDWIENATNTFEVAEHMVYGSAQLSNQSNELSVIGRMEGSNLVLNLASTSRIISVVVKEGANTTRLNSTPPDANNEVRFPAGSFSGTKTFTVIAQTETAGEITVDYSHTF